MTTAPRLDAAGRLRCEAPHPQWNRDPRRRGQTHNAGLPVRVPLGLWLELERLLPEGATLDDVRPDFWGVQCAHRNCGRIHEYRIVRVRVA